MRIPALEAALAVIAVTAAGSNASTGRPLTKVHIVAHSHNDPGWLESESEYFQQRSKKIITNVVESAYLPASPTACASERRYRAREPGQAVHRYVQAGVSRGEQPRGEESI